jgi:predicted HTH transcriptional regulator
VGVKVLIYQKESFLLFPSCIVIDKFTKKRHLFEKKYYLCKVKKWNPYIDESTIMELKDLIAECTAYDFKVMLEEKKPKSWLKSVSAFANGLGGSLFFDIDNDGTEKRLLLIQNVMAQLDYMEKRDSRLIRICNESKVLDGYKNGFVPKFKSTFIQFQTSIFPSSDNSNDGDVSVIKLSECQQKILYLIKELPTITGKKMSEMLSVGKRIIERDLSILQKSGILKHEGKDCYGVWIVN